MKIIDLDEELLNASLRIGEFYAASCNLWFCGLVKSEQGDFGSVMMVIDKLDQIGQVFGYDFAAVFSRGLKVNYLLNRRNMHEVVSEVEPAISIIRQENLELMEMTFRALKAEAQQLAGDAQGAQKAL